MGPKFRRTAVCDVLTAWCALLLQAVSGYDEAAMAPLMDKAAKMNLAKRHPELMATANAANDHLAAETKLASSITSAIKSRDKDALAVSLAKAREVC